MSLQSAKSSRSSKPVAQKSRPVHPESRKHLPSIAVLPFLDLRPEGNEAHLSEGLAEEVLQALNRIEDLRVISRTIRMVSAATIRSGVVGMTGIRLISAS